MFELYTKEEMLRKFKIPSPNLADAVKMLFKTVHNPEFGTAKRPIPIKQIGEGVYQKKKYRKVA